MADVLNITGLLFHAGSITLQPGVDTSISWDAFPTQVLGVQLTGNGGPAPNAFVVSTSVAGAVLNAGSNYAVTVSWLAVGK